MTMLPPLCSDVRTQLRRPLEVVAFDCRQVDPADHGTVGPAMSAGKEKTLSTAFLATTWRPGHSGNSAGHSRLYGEAVRLARELSLRAVQRLGELMESEDERVSVVACNSLLDRAFGKPKAVEEPKDDMDAQLASMSREERLALMNEVLADIERLRRLRQSLGSKKRPKAWHARRPSRRWMR